MGSLRRRVGLGILVSGSVLAVGAPAANAAISGSTITTPGDPTYAIVNDDSGASPTTTTVAGSTTGGNPGDQVDLDCFYGSTHKTLAMNVALQGDGTFSLPNADLSTIEGHVCQLRAVPAGTTPADLTPFSGPRMAVGQRNSSRVSSGPNAGTPFDFFAYAQQLTAADGYNSIGDCGLEQGYLFDSTFAFTAAAFECNDWFYDHELIADQGGPNTRSDVQVDGANAYVPWGADDINSQASRGFPSVAYSVTQDPTTGNVVITDSEQIVKCPDATFPPTGTSCATFVPTGVRDDRTMVQDHDGHLVTITDKLVSTDRAAHSLDLRFENCQLFNDGITGSAANDAYEFPGQASFATHVNGDTVNLPTTAPASIYVNYQGAADGDPAHGQGAITYDRAPDKATFDQLDPGAFGHSCFYLHDAANVPAAGSTTFRYAYSQAYTAAEVQQLAHEAEDAFSPPVVTIKQPADHSTVHNAKQKVAGTATDNVGITSLVVDGKKVTQGAGGAFAARVPLRVGKNTITAIAMDATGNSTQARVRVTYPKPKLTRLKVTREKIKKLRRSRRLKVKVGMNDAATVKLAAAARARTKKTRKVAFKHAKVRFSKPGRKTAKLKLTKAGRRALKGSRRVTVKIKATAKDPAGHRARRTAKRKLR